MLAGDLLYDYINALCEAAAAYDRKFMQMAHWYALEDKRPGTVRERFDQDAKEYNDYRRMFSRDSRN